MLSVIVPVFNSDKYLSSCIDSILFQTFRDFEVLLINDGSTDKSGEICDRYASLDSRINVIHQDNEGVSNARYLGVRKAKGEYITFIDSDDTLYKDSFEIMMENINNDIDILVSDAQVEKLISSEDFIKYILIGDLFSSIWGRLFRKSLFDNYIQNIGRNIVIGEDQLMNFKLVLGNKLRIKCIKKSVYIYRSNPNSITNIKKFTLEYEELFMNERLKVLGQYTHLFKNELYYNNLKTLENLIVCRVKVPYNRPWVQELIIWAKGQNLSLRNYLVLRIRHNLLCKYVLAIEKRMNYLFNKKNE